MKNVLNKIMATIRGILRVENIKSIIMIVGAIVIILCLLAAFGIYNSSIGSSVNGFTNKQYHKVFK